MYSCTLLFNFGARCWWEVNATPRPLYTRERPGAHGTGDGWAPGPVWTAAANLALPGFDLRTVQHVASCYTAWVWQPYRLHVPIILKSGSLNLLEPSGPVQASNETALLNGIKGLSSKLTFWRRNYFFFLILAHRVYKMWILRGLLEKYPTFGREKETGLLRALDT